MIPLYLPYYASTNQAALLDALKPGNHAEQDLRQFFREKFSFEKVFFTKSCTHALETIALLLDLQPGDEVIVPSYSYVSTANAFALHGAHIVFADSQTNHPNVDAQEVSQLISARTKAIVVMHYAGVAVDGLAGLKKTCDEKGIFLIEDAAHCINAFDGKTALGNTGHAATFSFHESKNIGCSSGGMLVVNHQDWMQRIEAVINKGTNRAMFERKEAGKYEWVDLGSAYKMDGLHLHLLNDQLKYLDEVSRHRQQLYAFYLDALMPLKEKGKIDFYIPSVNQQHNAHIFWIRLSSETEREKLRQHLLQEEVYSTFHYLALHKSPYGKKFAGNNPLPNAEKFEVELLRIPLYYPMSREAAVQTATAIQSFFS